jgi:hypothetical protein
MKQILVGRSIAYAAKVGGGSITSYKDIDSLDTGSIAFFTDENELITTANASTILVDKKGWYAAVGNQQASLLPPGVLSGSSVVKSQVTGIIPRVGMPTSVEAQSYVAPVNKIIVIGSNGTHGAFNQPTTLVAGTEAMIKIIKTTLGLRSMGGVYEEEIYRFSEVVRSGDTITTIANRLIVDINAVNPINKFVTASAVGSTTGISIVTDNYWDDFTVAVDGILINADRDINNSAGDNVSKAIVYGRGTDMNIAEMELTYSTERGNTNQAYLAQYFYKTPSLVVSGTHYDTWTFAWRGERKTSTSGQFTSVFELVIACPASAAQEASLITIIPYLVNGSEAAESGS